MATAKTIVDGLHQIGLGKVNAFLLEDPAGDVLIDTGYPGDAPKIVAALATIGKKPTDIRHIIVTHAHPDHFGALAAIQRETGAEVLVHSADRAVVEGAPLPPFVATPGFLSWLMVTFLVSKPPSLEPTQVSAELTDGQVLPFAGGLEVIHLPGHSSGQVALLWRRHGGVLIAADSSINILGLRLPPVCENVAETVRSLEKLSKRDFDVAVFGHGGPIQHNASKAFRAKWGR